MTNELIVCNQRFYLFDSTATASHNDLRLQLRLLPHRRWMVRGSGTGVAC